MHSFQCSPLNPVKSLSSCFNLLALEDQDSDFAHLCITWLSVHCFLTGQININIFIHRFSFSKFDCVKN